MRLPAIRKPCLSSQPSKCSLAQLFTRGRCGAGVSGEFVRGMRGGEVRAGRPKEQPRKVPGQPCSRSWTSSRPLGSQWAEGRLDRGRLLWVVAWRPLGSEPRWSKRLQEEPWAPGVRPRGQVWSQTGRWGCERRSWYHWGVGKCEPTAPTPPHSGGGKGKPS